MVWRIVWSDSALDRVTVFLDFIAEENPAAARRVIQKLFDRVDTLADFPHLGRPLLSGIDPTLRRIVFGSYIVVYQFQYPFPPHAKQTGGLRLAVSLAEGTGSKIHEYFSDGPLPQRSQYL